mmetsp:Transcript_14147/g.22054  ORF Transcript_14147/g.22054 Transcript_14147/m.22054 type:complete len:119 (-) Transcript_14147:198-554(-)
MSGAVNIDTRNNSICGRSSSSSESSSIDSGRVRRQEGSWREQKQTDQTTEDDGRLEPKKEDAKVRRLVMRSLRAELRDAVDSSDLKTIRNLIDSSKPETLLPVLNKRDGGNLGNTLLH